MLQYLYQVGSTAGAGEYQVPEEDLYQYLEALKKNLGRLRSRVQKRFSKYEPFKCPGQQFSGWFSKCRVLQKSEKDKRAGRSVLVTGLCYRLDLECSLWDYELKA